MAQATRRERQRRGIFGWTWSARRLALLLATLATATAVRAEGPAIVATPEDPAAVEFFEKEVRPLLARRCQQCHGQGKQKGELRLDSRSAVLEGGSTGPAVVPGKPEESLLVDAINYGELYRMPPKSKLPAAEIATLTRWVAIGAPWPRHDPSRSAVAGPAFDLAQRAKHWSFQPVRPGPLPEVSAERWPRTRIDRFILAALEARGLTPAPEADRRTLVRRLTFDLTGLPPTPAEVEAFVADDSPRAYECLVDRLLASPRYGERWGRHWLDLVRYAETSGHEFDYDLPDAFRYRDYVIRAFNADLPYDRFVVEHIAGDLLDPPRRHPAEGFNESVLATGFFFLGEGTHSPVDLLEDEAARVDNQIDVLSKAFLGLTVACARCHDHKFDAISTKDYYALYGFLQSSRHQHAFIDAPARVGDPVAELRALKDDLRTLVAVPTVPGNATPPRVGDAVVFEDFNGPGYRGWSVSGDAFGDRPTRAGDLRIAGSGKTAVLVPVTPGQAHSGLVSDRLQGVLRSRTFTIEKRFVHYLAAGRGRLNLVVDGFEKIRSPIYGGLTTEVQSEGLRWHTQDVAMWAGHRAAIELSDGGTVDFTGAHSAYFNGDGSLAVDEVLFSDQGPPPPPPLAPASVGVGGQGPGEERRANLVARYRAVEARIPPPTLAPAILDGDGEDEPVHIRGSTRTLGEVVPRRFLEAIAGADQPGPRSGSGRLGLARRMVDPTNPLIARVLVNRVWKHHFGRGIVATADDFGLMGERPTHPELLDDLAAWFMAEGWSIKALHRLILTSSSYRMSSRPDPETERHDPDNRLLHRMNVRRLEAEAIRDALLAASGRLDPAMYGPSVPPFLSPFMEGRGRPPASGPLDGDGRRSLYLGVRRNFLNPMFLAFDFPSPFSTMGRRNVSNVPAQALTLLNDPFVVGEAARWAERVLRLGDARTPRARLEQLYLTAFGRPPTDLEVAEALAFLDGQGNSHGRPDDPRAWADLCHVLINVKEFIYVN